MQLKAIAGAVVVASALQPLLGLSAGAETMIVRKEPVLIEQTAPLPATENIMISQPGMIWQPGVAMNVPSKRVVLSRSVVVNPAVSTQSVLLGQPVLQPATQILSQPTVITQPATVTKSQMIMTSTPKASIGQSSDISLSTGPIPVFHKRLALMKEQVDKAQANGWISQAQADGFRGRIDVLTREADAKLLSSAGKDQLDQLEREVNALNIDLSNSMQNQIQ